MSKLTSLSLKLKAALFLHDFPLTLSLGLVLPCVEIQSLSQVLEWCVDEQSGTPGCNNNDGSENQEHVIGCGIIVHAVLDPVELDFFHGPFDEESVE